MQIHDRWHQIFGVSDGRTLSLAVDCNAFGLQTASGLILFDAGAGADPDVQDRALASAGFPDGPTHIFLTHGHIDHSGGVASLLSERQARLFAGPMTAEWLAAGDEAKISLPAARQAGIYASSYLYRPAAVDEIVKDRVPIHIDDVAITPLATPGHSADHFSYLVQAGGNAVLIGGDAIFANGTVVLQDTWDCSVAATCQSIRGLSAIQFDMLLPGHGPCILSNAGHAVQIAMERIDRLLPPLNFL